MTLETMERGDTMIKIPSPTEPFTHETANQFIEDYFPEIQGIVGNACKKIGFFSAYDPYIHSEEVSDALERIAKDLVRYDPEKNTSVSSWIFSLAYHGIQDGLRDRDPVSRMTRRTLKSNMTLTGDYDGPFSNATFHATHPPLSWEELPEKIPDKKGNSVEEVIILDGEEKFDIDLKRKVIQRFFTSGKYKPRDKKVLQLFLSGVNNIQISKEIGVSESRVSQLNRKIAKKLCTIMENYR